MSLAVFEHVCLGFGKKTIVDDLDLRVSATDRIGLIGPNGSGKTSLLRLLAGEQAPDSGRIHTRRELRLGYLPQDITLAGDKPLLSFVLGSVQGRAILDRQIAQAERELEAAKQQAARKQTDGEQALMETAEHLAELHERATHYALHFTEHEARRILSGLGFETADHEISLAKLSGGWKMRAVLASLLFQKPDLLLLDEPTNHLDMPSVTWFSDFLRQYDRAFILICHDREFLNEQIARVVSFETEGVRQYAGDYEQYLRQREEEQVILENKAKNLAREREQAERFINRFRAQANKAKAVQSRVKQLAKMESVETYVARKVMRMRFPPCARAGAEPIRAQGLSKRYGDKVVLRDVDLTVRRGEKIGIIGVNGAGKTTLLRMLAGEIAPSAGSVELGHNIKPGYYAQHHADTLDGNATIFEQVSREVRDIGVTQIRTVLGAFLFSDDDADKKIGVLSGGERARVALARLLVDPGNLLMMDEPTNHLDLASSEALAESLAGYDGTLMFVSHNRSFVRRLATRIWNVADQRVEVYPGTLDEYMDSWRARQSNGATSSGQAAADAREKAAAPARKRGTRAEEKARKRREAEERAARARGDGAGDGDGHTAPRTGRKLASEVAELEQRIEALEAEQKARSAELAEPEVFADKARSQVLLEAFKQAQDELKSLHARWERAAEQLEDAQG